MHPHEGALAVANVWLRVLFPVALVAASGCGDDDGTPPRDGPGDGDGADAGADGERADLGAADRDAGADGDAGIDAGACGAIAACTPAVVATNEEAGGGDLVVVDGVAYIAGGYFYTVDVSDPTAPVWLATVEISEPAVARDVVVVAGLAYVASTGFMVFDVSDSAAPALTDYISSYDVDGTCSGVALGPGVAYLACTMAGLLIVDISDPTDLQVVGTYTDELVEGVTSFPTAIDAVGTTVYVDKEERLFIFDASDPTSPVKLAEADVTGGSFIYGVRVESDLAYMATTGGLEIADVSDPASPKALGAFATVTKQPGDLDLVGTTVYLSLGEGLLVVDASDPTAPEELAYLSMTSNPVGVAGGCPYAFVGTIYVGLEVVEVCP